MPKRPLISIVDDDESVREATQSLMRALGFPAESFPSAGDFLSSDDLDSTRCLIADVQMPGMTGLELHNHLVATGHPIPTVLITAYPSDAIRSRALQAGVIAYLTKPFREDELLGYIESAIAGSERSGDGA